MGATPKSGINICRIRGFLFMTRLILIRHGQTDYNLQRRYCGFTDIGINKAGRLRTKKIKSELREFTIDKVFCSDLKRSLQTAKIIFGNARNIIVRPALREINFGDWEGLTFGQIFKRNPLIYKRWAKDPFSADIPSGENMDSFLRRIRSEFKNIVQYNCYDTMAIVGHLGPIRVILNTCANKKKNNFWKLQIEPQSIYIIEYGRPSKPKVYEL